MVAIRLVLWKSIEFPTLLTHNCRCVLIVAFALNGTDSWLNNKHFRIGLMISQTGKFALFVEMSKKKKKSELYDLRSFDLIHLNLIV